MSDYRPGMGLSDAVISTDENATRQLEEQLARQQASLIAMGNAPDDPQRLQLVLEIADTLLALERNQEAWDTARRAFDTAMQLRRWHDAVQACELLYRCDLPESIAALGNGVWLAVTFPVDPQLSANMLEHVVDETPPDSDGAAVAAATAHYLAELRSRDAHQRDSLGFLTGNLLAAVANRHSGIKDRDGIDAWVERLELDRPDKLLPRLAMMLNIIVGEHWWIDRDSIRSTLPRD